jgi:hypothetical protein
MTIQKTIPLFVGAGLLAAALLSLVVVLAGAYYAHWDGAMVRAVANTIPVPAASVGKRSIPVRAYLADVDSIERYLSSPEAERQNVRRPIVDTDKQQVLERLIQEAALRELADARNIYVTDQQVEAVMTELSVATTSTEAFVAFLDENYGWDMAEFRSHVVEPLILTRLLTDSYAADHGGDPAALEQYMQARIQERDVIRYVKF